MSAFLSDTELTELTGYKLKSRQAQWLRDEGIPHRVNGIGRPIVIMSDICQSERQQPKVSGMPNFKALAALNA